MDLTREEFENVRDMIRQRCGLWLADQKMSFLRSRLAARLAATSMETVREYYYYLRYDPGGEEELCSLIESVLINETCFFREEAQLQDLCETIVPGLLDGSGKAGPLCLWSAACSTGEEPYTLAILLLEHPLRILPHRVAILASDISHTALQSARQGVYDGYSLRKVPAQYLRQYFEAHSDGRCALKDRVKQMVQFAGINLLDPMETGRIKNMDCVLCRNTLIYFDDEGKRRCVEHLYRSLNRGGFLLLGHSESLGRIPNPFEVVRLKQTIAYRRR